MDPESVYMYGSRIVASALLTAADTVTFMDLVA